MWGNQDKEELRDQDPENEKIQRDKSGIGTTFCLEVSANSKVTTAEETKRMSIASDRFKAQKLE